MFLSPFLRHVLLQAAAYLRMRVAHVAVDAQTRKVDLIAMKKAITKNTCMVSHAELHYADEKRFRSKNRIAAKRPFGSCGRLMRIFQPERSVTLMVLQR